MELKAGYKQTEVGVIPEDWEVAALGNLSQILRGGSPRPIEMYLTRNRDGYNWIKIGDVAPNAKYIFATEEKIIKEGRERSRFVHEGDLLLSNSMSFGRPYILQIDGCIHDGWLVIQNYKDTFDTNFLYYLLCSEQTLKQYKAKAAGSGVLNLNKELVASVLLGYPTKPEQKAIASALSDVDGLLSSLDALIAKKRDIKTAAMQELLTGKRRLPGFSEEWKNVFAYEYGEFVRGVSYDHTGDLSYKKKENTLILLRANNIHNDFINFLDIYWINKNIVDESQILKAGDILFCMSNGSKRLVGKSAAYEGIISHPVTFGAFMGVLRPNGNLNKSFLKYIFQSYMFISYINIILSGSAINNLTPANILNFDFSIPTDHDEQAAIAAVLSDMDAEITALEARRAKVQSLKQGMMQELLTGRTRLLPEGEQHG